MRRVQRQWPESTTLARRQLDSGPGASALSASESHIQLLGRPVMSNAFEADEDRSTGVHANHSSGRTLATVFGAPLAAGALSGALSLLLPTSRAWSASIAVDAVAPLWIIIACLLPLARSGLRAWAYCVVLALPLFVALVAER